MHSGFWVLQETKTWSIIIHHHLYDLTVIINNHTINSKCYVGKIALEISLGNITHQ